MIVDRPSPNGLRFSNLVVLYFLRLLRASVVWSTGVGSIVGSTNDMTRLAIQLIVDRTGPISITGPTHGKKKTGRFFPQYQLASVTI